VECEHEEEEVEESHAVGRESEWIKWKVVVRLVWE